MSPRRRLPDIKRPLWWRILAPIMVAYYRWCDESVVDELAANQALEQLAIERGETFRIGPKYLHNCAVQREALREKIAHWNR